MELIRNLSSLAYALIAIAGTTVILLSGTVAGWQNALRVFTRENGIIEWGSVAALFAVAGIAATALLRDRQGSSGTKLQRIVLWLLLAGGLLAALEEISWGQQIFGFRASQFFRDHNLQRETNLHNLLPASISSSIINGTIYALFLWLPCLVRLQPRGRLACLVARYGAKPLLPGMQTMLMFAFGSALQAYFHFMTWTDTAALAATLFLLAMVLMRDSSTTRADRVHFLLIVTATGLYMLHYDVFRFANMQYEIRELIVVVACLHWLGGWAIPQRKTSSHSRSS